MFEIITACNSVIIAVILICGGWVKIRAYLEAKSKSKAEEAKVAAQKVEAAIQARIDAAVAEAKAATTADSTSV